MTAVAAENAARSAIADEAALAIYVHWPFCVAKCPYCDFNSHVRATIDEDAWRTALLTELAHFHQRTAGRPVTSVFFGGGTPSLMAPPTVEAVLDCIASRWPLARDVEVTLEANPNSAERVKFQTLRAAGVNRLSLGVQALDDASLRALGRAHDASEARQAIVASQRVFDRTSFDLIYARPGQDVAAWRRELKEALAVAGEHVSVYQLTIEPGTAFHGLHARGELRLPDEETAAALFETTQEILAAARLPAYEVSNHARPGAECRHNLVYWRYGDYLGVGPGAHGRLATPAGKIATRQERAPETWLRRVSDEGHATAEESVLDRPTASAEAVMMGLRLTEGLDPARFERATGLALDAALDAAAVTRLVDGCLLCRTPNGGLATTAAGRRVLNAVLGELLA